MFLALGGGVVFYLGFVVSRSVWGWRQALRALRGEQKTYAQRLAAHTRRYEALQEVRFQEKGWEGFRRFVVKQKVWEDANRNVCSLDLIPEDGKPLPDFKPGQFLTFRVTMQDANGRDKQVVRCYSLSCAHTAKPYRISIKRLTAAPGSGRPPGLMSNFLHDTVAVGDVLQVRAPAGGFWLDVTDDQPVVLVAGGIGITPVFSMLASLMEAGSPREIWFFYGLRHGGEHVFREQLDAWAVACPNLHLVVCYDQPRPEDRLGLDYHVAGRVSVALFKQRLAADRTYGFYI